MAASSTWRRARRHRACPRAITDLGFYDTIMDEDAYRATKADPTRVDELWRTLATERLQRWVAMAEDRLGPAGIRCYVSGWQRRPDRGDDRATGESGHARSSAVKVASYPSTTITDGQPAVREPHAVATPREAPEDELAEMIEEQVAGLADLRTRSSISMRRQSIRRSTPVRCSTQHRSAVADRAWRTAGHVRGGQSAVRSALGRHQPLLGLHGHIHESQSAARIGRTLASIPAANTGRACCGAAASRSPNGTVTNFQMTTDG